MRKYLVLGFIVCCIGVSAFSQQPAYKNKNLTPEERTEDLLSRMTVDEKIMQLQCIWQTKPTVFTNGDFDLSKARKLLMDGLGEIARINETGGVNSPNFHPKEAAMLYNKVQKFFIEETRLGIPVMMHEESSHGMLTQDATNFPVPMGLASTWNENLMTEIFTAVASEVRAKGAQHVLAPVVDVVRDPRWGRTDECMGEDPFLISKLAVAEVKAYQGNSVYLGKNKVAVTLKHFGVHGQPEGGNNTAPSNVDERLAREIFFKPFKACIDEANPMNIMVSYNELWGIPAHSNKKLITDILRKEWGYKGAVVSDYGGITNLNTIDKVAGTIDEAGYLAFKSGVNSENPDPDGYKNLKQFIDNGKISTEELDYAVSKILINKFRLRLFDDPYLDPEKSDQIVGNERNRATAYKAASEAIVLLKNDNNFLPLDKSKIKTIAFIGPNADRCILGGYSGNPRVKISPLQALKEKYGDKMTILYAEGVKITDTNSPFPEVIKLVPMDENYKRIAEAIEIAKKADVVVLFVGGNEATSREAYANTAPGDLPTLDLLNGQNELVSQIVALGKPTCAFVNSGPPLSIGKLADAVPAVMQCWFLGQEGGYAMVDALFGEINPSGKLPISIPRSAGHIPAYYNYKPSSRRGYNLGLDVSPLFPFGYGLSYTTFQYSNLKLSNPTMKKDGSVEVSVDVKNTGSRRGAEVVQMYIRDDYSSIPRPVKELKGFKKIWLDPGQSKEVTFTVSPELLAFYDTDMKWVVESGDFTIMVGISSVQTDSIKLKVIE
jgi:beta-glucosidase